MGKDMIYGIKTGDMAVFNNAYLNYHKPIYDFVFYKTQSDFIASEVVQLTFIRLWERRTALVDNLELNIQLFGMARQVMIDQLRKEATRFRYNQQSDQHPFTDNLMNMIESKDMLKQFEQEIAAMPPIRKTVFNLSRNNGLSYAEIAEIMDISTKTVESHIGKVLSRLKQYMFNILF
ncbi:RNA polymerase sigma-70 factor, ECF subfamily [Pedobacter rhizosphaerae]|uniref:RNA polymerase sigma-70 factor, ECF subfamily n=2 Tax=Pedobacter rhizosphaerae TaxID=390241 RepID=A0A1H9JYF4_9SPHI|nr:RNA polymerase sigma-70 factor, ECF subfamily [Pedobacter rhizosphaerae]